jgi:hypothetical protein
LLVFTGSELKDKIDRKLFLERSAVEYQQRVRVAAQQEIARMQNKSAAPATTAAAEKSDAEKSGKVAGSPSTAALHSFVNHRKVTVKAL